MISIPIILLFKCIIESIRRPKVRKSKYYYVCDSLRGSNCSSENEYTNSTRGTEITTVSERYIMSSDEEEPSMTKIDYV